MKIFKNWGKRNWIIFGVSLAFIAVTIGAGFQYYSHLEEMKQEAIANAQNEVNSKWEEWGNLEEEWDVRMEFFKTFSNETYTKDANYKEVEDLVNEKMVAMKEWFVGKCNEALEANTLKDVENISEKDPLSKSLADLETWKKHVETDGDLFFDEEAKEKWMSDCQSLVDSYKSKVAAIEKEEEERKAEEERLANESTTSQQQIASSGNQQSSTQQSGGQGSKCTIHKVNGEYLYNGECGVVTCSVVPGTNLCYNYYESFETAKRCDDPNVQEELELNGGSCSNCKFMYKTPDFRFFCQDYNGKITEIY